MNTDELWPSLEEAEQRVLRIQTKLHQWAVDDPNRRFDDLYNLIYDPAVLVLAWRRVRSNRGARSAGVDGATAHYISAVKGEQVFLSALRDELKARRFRPAPVREALIPKPGGKHRRLGIATVADRVAQAALKLVLEPIFEADFLPCSYGFRPGRRAHDAIAEIHHFCSHSYEWIVEGDIEACFDSISHSPLLQRVRRRIGDKRVVALVKAFLKSGILAEGGELRDSDSGAPQGGILSPLLSNIALSVLDEHFAKAWETMSTPSARKWRRRKGRPNYRLVRYADDWVAMVAGDRADAERVRDEAAAVLLPIGLRLSEAKTAITHIDQGLDFLGVRIQRHQKRGSAKRFVYTYPSKAALAAVTDKVRRICREVPTNEPLVTLLRRLSPTLRGWVNYHRHGVSKATFQYLCSYVWHRVTGWLRRKHRKANWALLRRRYLPGWWPTEDEVVLFNPSTVAVTRYRYRGQRIPSPWASPTQEPATTHKGVN